MNDRSSITFAPITDTTLERLTLLFGAMADPTRARMLLHLRQQNYRSGDLAALLGMTPSAVSHQLRWLRQNNVVAAQKVGREVFYELADVCIAELMDVALRHIEEQEGN